MKELNLTVGQKCWSIQLGDCEVSSLAKDHDFPILLKSNDGRTCLYTESLKYNELDACRSVFLSNPFEPNLVQENKDGWIELKESKAELINALFNIANVDWDTNGGLVKMARGKLHKLLESL